MTPVHTAPANTSEDTEITLGTGKMLALFFALVIVCAVFFALGYSVGRSSTKSAAELLPSPNAARLPTSRVATPAPSPPAPAPAEQQPQSGGERDSDPNPTAATPQPVAGTLPQPEAAYFVQVAAVSKQEDAQALVDSLKGRQYEAFIADSSPDKLFHVQVGPFNDVKQAESMRTRLVNDGYNPILKK
jgi:DedD protein